MVPRPRTLALRLADPNQSPSDRGKPLVDVVFVRRLHDSFAVAADKGAAPNPKTRKRVKANLSLFIGFYLSTDRPFLPVTLRLSVLLKRESFSPNSTV